MATEEQLIASAKEGSVSAFSELFENYQERLLRFLVTRCRTRTDAEDAIQDTFINAFRYIGSYNPRWKFSTWLFRIALRNAAKVGELTQGIEEDVIEALEELIESLQKEIEKGKSKKKKQQPHKHQHTYTNTLRTHCTHTSHAYACPHTHTHAHIHTHTHTHT